MKLALATSIATALTYTTNAWPTSATRWFLTLDARPEAILTGAALLLLAAVLSRGVTARRVP